MKAFGDYVRTEIENAIGESGYNHGLRPELNTPVAWDLFGQPRACLDVAWFDRERDRLLIAWMIGDADDNDDNRRSSYILANCVAVVKVVVVASPVKRSLAQRRHGLLFIEARKLVGRASGCLGWFAQLALDAAPFLSIPGAAIDLTSGGGA